MREGTLHLVYFREYEDSEERYDPFFNIYYTIFRNLPLSQMNRLNNKDFQKKVTETKVYWKIFKNLSFSISLLVYCYR